MAEVRLSLDGSTLFVTRYLYHCVLTISDDAIIKRNESKTNVLHRLTKEIERKFL